MAKISQARKALTEAEQLREANERLTAEVQRLTAENEQLTTKVAELEQQKQAPAKKAAPKPAGQ